MSFGKRSVFGGGGGGGGGIADIGLNLTALMDILSNLLFFLLASYTAQAVEIEGREGLKLPASSSELVLSQQLTITVTTTQIDVSGVPVANVQNGALVAEPDAEGKIGPLFERLRNVKLSRAGAGRADLADADLLLLLADKGTDSRTITSILKTAGHAGFFNVRFGVISR